MFVVERLKTPMYRTGFFRLSSSLTVLRIPFLRGFPYSLEITFEGIKNRDSTSREELDNMHLRRIRSVATFPEHVMASKANFIIDKHQSKNWKIFVKPNLNVFARWCLRRASSLMVLRITTLWYESSSFPALRAIFSLILSTLRFATASSVSGLLVYCNDRWHFQTPSDSPPISRRQSPETGVTRCKA